MHLGTLISKKLDRIDEENIIIGFFAFVMVIVIVMLFAAMFMASYNDIKKQNLEHKSHDIQITNTK